MMNKGRAPALLSPPTVPAPGDEPAAAGVLAPARRFLKITVKNHLILHGFDAENREIIDTFEQEEPMTKLIAIDRIQSIGERYILTSYGQDRLIYWEYEEDFETLEARLAKHGLVIA
jgi:bisphosphoglycerate-independent phosphoglycerate mutase (AlkP superfamily)